MKALVLAAGYATRLRPLTDSSAKPLLPVAGRPILDWILDAIGEVGDIDEVHVVTNARYALAFGEWAAGTDIRIHDDGTHSNDDRLGAIGDLSFVLRETGIDDDLLVIAGDNLFEFDLGDFVGFWRGFERASALAVHDVGSRELAKHYGIVALDGASRVVDFVEKPSDPPSTLAATATYLFHRDHVALVATYLAEGNSHDQPGHFVNWLRSHEAVYGWVFTESWFDIGSEEQLLEADNHMRARHGLPQRDVYTPAA